jgi:hypothetical protein
MTPDLEAHGPYVVARRGETTQQVADCSVSQHGAEYARLFAQSIKLRDALEGAIDTIRGIMCADDSCNPPIDLSELESVLAAATGKGEPS